MRVSRAVSNEEPSDSYNPIRADSDSELILATSSSDIPPPVMLFQYAIGLQPLPRYIMTLYGLYTSASPKRYPSYHSLISEIFSGGFPVSSRRRTISSSVNPKYSSPSVSSMLHTLALLKLLSMLVLARGMIPVTTANS